MVVVAIIIVLSSMIVPTMKGQIESANRQEAVQTARQFQSYMRVFAERFPDAQTQWDGAADYAAKFVLLRNSKILDSAMLIGYSNNFPKGYSFDFPASLNGTVTLTYNGTPISID